MIKLTSNVYSFQNKCHCRHFKLLAFQILSFFIWFKYSLSSGENKPNIWNKFFFWRNSGGYYSIFFTCLYIQNDKTFLKGVYYKPVTLTCLRRYYGFKHKTKRFDLTPPQKTKLVCIRCHIKTIFYPNYDRNNAFITEPS